MSDTTSAKFERRRKMLVDAAPIPVLWLLGKTGSGKTSIIRYLTGSSDAEIGTGFKPQTRYSRVYDFPDAITPVIRFRDTRGIGEIEYDSTEDLAEHDHQAHLLVVTVRAMDQAVDEIFKLVKKLRRANPERPVLLVLSCLHDGYPGKQHSDPSPFEHSLADLPDSVPEKLRLSITSHLKLFGSLVDETVAIDLTPTTEGFEQPDLGGAQLKQAILNLLPAAYRHTLLQMDALNRILVREHQRRVAPLILAHSWLAATAAAVPLPWADIPLVLGIQSRLAFKIAKLNRQKLDSRTVASISAAMGGRIAARMAVRESLKFIPWVGSAVNAAATFALTFASGWAWNWYFMEISKGHIPTSQELQAVYSEQLKRGEIFWKATSEKNSD